MIVQRWAELGSKQETWVSRFYKLELIALERQKTSRVEGTIHPLILVFSMEEWDTRGGNSHSSNRETTVTAVGHNRVRAKERAIG